MIGNSSGIDFRAQGVLDFPTEGWFIQNTDNHTDWADVSEEEQLSQEGPYVVPSVGITPDAFSIMPQQVRGFSLLGEGGDVINHIEILPITGENGVNPYIEEEEDVLGDGLFGGYDFEYGMPFENELGAVEEGAEFAEYDGLDQISGRHASFRTAYDNMLDKVLAV